VGEDVLLGPWGIIRFYEYIGKPFPVKTISIVEEKDDLVDLLLHRLPYVDFHHFTLDGYR
jgi:hypothetical protein